jgi:hypothetical protein
VPKYLLGRSYLSACLITRGDTLIEVPGPEGDWELATAYQGGKRNPALQGSLWDYAAGGFRLVAGLSPSLVAGCAAATAP